MNTPIQLQAKAKPDNFAELFGEYFHTYWRKGSDSPYSTTIWNLIYCLPPAAWGAYCKHVSEQLKEITPAALKTACQSWDEEAVIREHQFTGKNRHLIVAYWSLLRHADDDEWVGLYYFF